LLDNTNGEINFKLITINHKIDTIVTYEYDDDFNKIEVKSTQNIAVPELDLKISSTKHQHLSAYLWQKKSIQIIDKDTLFTSFPLYKFYTQFNQNNLLISTNKKKQALTVYKTNQLLNAYVNVDQYLKNQFDFFKIPAHNEYLNLIEWGSIQLTDKNKISLTIMPQNKNRNFFGQCVKH